MSFISDLDFGKIFEKQCTQKINSNKAYRVVKENNDKKYDIAAINRFTGSLYLFECKSDRKSQYTGNIFFETKINEKYTNLSENIATHYILEFNVDGIKYDVVIKRNDIYDLDGEKVSGGDYGKSIGLLIPVFKLMKFPTLDEFLDKEIEENCFYAKEKQDNN